MGSGQNTALSMLGTVFTLLLPWTAAGSDPTLSERGARLEKLGRWKDAADLYRRAALERRPEKGVADSGERWVKRAMIAYLTADRLDDAEELTERLLAKYPDYHEVLFFLGDSQRVALRYEDARQTLEKLREHEPDHPRGTLLLAHVLTRLGRPREALRLFEAALAQPLSPEHLRKQGELDFARALRALGEHRRAADHLVGLLEDDPLDPPTLAEAARVFLLLGKTELATTVRRDFQWVSRRGHLVSDEDPGVLYSSGTVDAKTESLQAVRATDRREFHIAIDRLERSLARSPENPVVRLQLARLWLRLGRLRECLEVTRAPPDVPTLKGELRLARAQALHGLGKHDEARGALEHAVDAGRDPDVLLEAATAELDWGGDKRQAARWLQGATRLSPRDHRIQLALARAALEGGATDSGRKVLASLPVSLKKESREFRRLVALARGMEGDLSFAAREFMALVVESPDDLKTFRAFEAVFGTRTEEPVVRRVLAMKEQVEHQRQRTDALRRQLAATPLARSGALYRTLAELALQRRDRQGALDALYFAAHLEAEDTRALHRLRDILRRPDDTFERLHVLRRILARSPRDAAALEDLARTYLDLSLRLDEAEALALRLREVRPDAATDAVLEAVRRQRGAP